VKQDVKSLTDQQLKENLDLIKAFESARSYRASLLNQAMRLAEMEGRTADRDRLKAEAEQAKEAFTELSDADRAIQSEMEDRRAAAEAAAEANANANAKK
jgi:hypothetical protein